MRLLVKVFFMMLSVSIILINFILQANDASGTARLIFEQSGVSGGLIVHIGAGNGQLTAALRVNKSCLVHGLEKDPDQLEFARKYIHAHGLYGPVSISAWDGEVLPYAENLVNLIVSEEPGNVSKEEMLRVLAPRGVAVIKLDGIWNKTVKPVPVEIDEWTHFLQSPNNNAVANDKIVGPPRRLQWVNPPLWSRSHEHLGNMSAAVTAGGRLFYIMDKAPAADITIPPEWTLVARDAFNGVHLWEQPIKSWEWRLRPFRSGPPDLPRRLVANDDRLYVTPGYGEPVVALDAATGETIREYEQTNNTQEIILSDGVLYLVLGHEPPESAERQAARAAQAIQDEKIFQWYLPIYEDQRSRTHIMAVDAVSGKTLWHKTGSEVDQVMPTTLAVAGRQVFFQNPSHVISLDALNGQELWRGERSVNRNRVAWSTPTLVVYEGVVISADRDKGGEGDYINWLVHARGTGEWGQMIAFSAETGQRLWSAPCREGYNSPVDVLVVDGLVWTGDIVFQRDGQGITQGRNLRTGEVERTRPGDLEFYKPVMTHARCHRSKATARYLLTGRSGVEFADVIHCDEGGIPHHWVRGECQYGVIPANGLLYAPPHPCACFILAKLNSFHALSAGEPVDLEQIGKTVNRLDKGPAYDKVEPHEYRSGDWLTYRHDAARSGSTKEGVQLEGLAPVWQTRLPEPLTAPVKAGGQIFVASVNTHTVYALDARTGEHKWQFTAGSRVDSPPTIWNGRIFFGSADGWVYSLRERDGALVWRHRAAPVDRLIVSDGRLESAWPVHGSVLIQPCPESSESAIVFAAAGRSGYLDGGIVLTRIDAETGHELSRTPLDSRDPVTGHQPHPLPDSPPGFSMPGILNDVLSAQGENIFMRHNRFDLDGNLQDNTMWHLHSPAGFLDDSWWHRTYWMVGLEMHGGWHGWHAKGPMVPSGRLLVLDDERVYGFGRDRYHRGGSHVGIGEANYKLFARDMSVDPRRAAEEEFLIWTKHVGLFVRGMVLAGNTLFVAGPPDPLKEEDPARVWEGRDGGRLLGIVKGINVLDLELVAPPVFDGLIAANGSLYMSTTDGNVICFSKKNKPDNS